ncbi:hypothetical protein GDO86_002704 [Hymenochirus boettgeri]|uniref:Hexosyltransferase n=1 Tax=Hymenochirus boettgeri TaxID=247094 RepID=A0A8T2JY98_9PIPI|nr:hypothetical protein GDO86_002704 [Hymenochirus boettgeri]
MARRKLKFSMVIFFSIAMLCLFFMQMNVLDFGTIFPKMGSDYTISWDDINRTFILLPKVDCKKNPPYLVLLITTSHHQKEARMAIRQSWGKNREILGQRVSAFFLLGTSGNVQKEAELANESLAYNDIIQRPFVDAYYNLTIKTVMGIDWISERCPETKFVMKTDADMFVNTVYLVELLRHKTQSNFFTGFLKLDEYPIRNIFSKWYVSKREFPGVRYPPFCSGTGYVFSADVAQKLHKLPSTIPFFKLEDVFVGLCLERLKIDLQELHSEQTFFPEKPYFSTCRYKRLVTSHGHRPDDITVYWALLERSGHETC